jgi:hypothetical protein
MRTEAATQTARVNAARRRFEKQKAEMEAWGCTVILPATLTPPDMEKPGSAVIRNRA